MRFWKGDKPASFLDATERSLFLICAKQLLHVIVLHALSDAVIAKMVQLGFRSGTSRARQKDPEHASSGTLFAHWTAVECRKFHCFLSSFVC